MSVNHHLSDFDTVLLVHVTGLRTHAGIRVWVWWVPVRFSFEVPVTNPYPRCEFGGFFKAEFQSQFLATTSTTTTSTVPHSTSTLLNMSNTHMMMKTTTAEPNKSTTTHQGLETTHLELGK